MRRLRFLSFVVSCLVFALVGPASAEHQWGSYHWGRTANPFTLPVVDNLDEVWSPVLAEHAGVWDDPDVLTLEVDAGDPTVIDCPWTPGVVQACNADYGATGWVGMAQVESERKGHLTAATVRFNDHYVDGATYDGTSADGAPLRDRKRRALVCHELGHALGLTHPDTDFDNPPTDSCLDYVRAEDLTAASETPNGHDRSMLGTMYGHTDRRATVGADGGDPDTGGKGNGKGKNRDRGLDAAWGTEVEAAADGSHSVFERQRGSKVVFTIVTWAR